MQYMLNAFGVLMHALAATDGRLAKLQDPSGIEQC